VKHSRPMCKPSATVEAEWIAATEKFMNTTGNGRPRGGKSPARRAAVAVLIIWAVCGTSSAMAGLGRPRIDPRQVVPLDQLPAESREAVAEVIRDHTLHRQGEPDSFPCSAALYLSLVNEPALTLALWKDLADSPVRLQKIGPDRYQGEDGAGTTATWDFIYRNPRLHILLGHLNYLSPRGNARIEARIVLVVHTGYYREVNNETYVQHDVEAFVKIDSRGWKTLARTMRPVIERVLEEQVREAGLFVSLMSRLVVMYPNWATHVALGLPELDAETKSRFRDIVAQNRMPGASSGRPVVVATHDPAAGAVETTRR
jgi:hypothetical protein